MGTHVMANPTPKLIDEFLTISVRQLLLREVVSWVWGLLGGAGIVLLFLFMKGACK
jgi:hypothetical protein